MTKDVLQREIEKGVNLLRNHQIQQQAQPDPARPDVDLRDRTRFTQVQVEIDSSNRVVLLTDEVITPGLLTPQTRRAVIESFTPDQAIAVGFAGTYDASQGAVIGTTEVTLVDLRHPAGHLTRRMISVNAETVDELVTKGVIAAANANNLSEDDVYDAAKAALHATLPQGAGQLSLQQPFGIPLQRRLPRLR